MNLVKTMAHRYLDMGWYVMPIAYKSKVPTMKGWKERTTLPTHEEIDLWFANPKTNIGLVTGLLSKVSILDADGAPGIRSMVDLKLTSTVQAVSGKGKHLFYADPEGKARNFVKKHPGLDARGEGGQVLIYPSIHPNGQQYKWLSRFDAPLPPFPEQFIAPVAAKPATSSGKVINDSSGYTQTQRLELLEKALPKLSKERCDNYDTWIKVGMALKEFGAVGYGLWDRWSRTSPKYSERTCSTKWDTFEETCGITIGSIIHWAREDSGEAIRLGTSQSQFGNRPSSNLVETSDNLGDFLCQPENVEWIVPNLIAQKSIGFVAGLPETMKTWLLIDLAIKVAMGSGLWLGMFSTKPGKVLFIDQERFKGETQRRFTALLATMATPITDQLKAQLFIKCGTTIKLDLEASYQAFRKELLEMKPTLVIVDSFAAFHTKNQTEHKEIQMVMERIKQLRTEIGCTFLFINHETKQTFQDIENGVEPTMQRMVGSVAVGAAVETCLTVRKLDDSHSTVFHTKSTLGKKQQAFTIELLDENGGVSIKKFQDASET